MSAIPSHTNVLVIGGGPGGAYTATVLARESVEVTVLEAAQFPRYHIGESMLPSINHFYEYIGAEEKLRGFGFAKKVGAAAKFKQNKREAYTNFIEHDPRNAAVNVVRSDLDELLLRHAQESGATVFEQTRVTDIVFEEGRDPVRSDNPRPVGVNYVQKDGRVGYITFDYLVDASGTKGLMSTKYLRNRKMNHTLHNIACWGYWSGAGMYMPGTERHNAPWFESLTDESGWVWFIPLHNGTVSVGFVMDMEVTIQKKAALREKNPDEYSLKAHYLDQLQYAPGVQDLLKNATFKSEGGDSGVKSASDFSYSANFYAGDHYRLVGDAAAFIDPFFSSGVHLAHIGGLSAAVSICASIKKQCTEQEAAKYHDMRVSRSYTRFLMVVLSAYKQIRSQTGDYLSTPEEDNYDRAFDFYRPIILGTADVGAKITQDELEKALDFCAGVLFPGDPELKDSVGTHIGFDLLKASGPMTGYDAGEAKIDAGDDTFGMEKSDGKTIALHAALDAIAKDKIDGFVPNLTRGSLGLTKDASTGM